PELVAAQEELLLASRLEGTVWESAVPGVPAGTSDLLGAARRRMQLWDISDAQIEEILRSGHVQRTLTLYSPVSGVVTEKNVVQGQAIQAGQMLFTISDLSEVWIEAELRERELASVRTGTAADIEVAAYPDRSFTGRVEFIDPTLDSQARTAKARVAVRNGRALLKPGMFVTVRLKTPTRTALTAPTSAIIRTGERTVVFVDVGNGRLTPQEIDIGRVAGEITEVLAGLEPGQRVVTSAQFLLDSESNLAEVMKAMMGQIGASDMGDMDMDVMPGVR
ncbi:MAG TPA: efflux RND transporter periplasmic adaptor subunit, partial [Gemmatimonadaceae bacterium]|nr:efflux RND transporter periplasmic adaptor subunit [Gemmatimonadaceae bacterium]